MRCPVILVQGMVRRRKGVVAPMEREPVLSSTIESVGYDPVTAVLEIQFTHGDL